MRVLKLREFWNKNDDNLMINNHFTKAGIAAYWCSLDALFHFNIKKREEFMIRNKFRAFKSKSDEKRQGQAKRLVPEDNEDEILEFFTRRRFDQFHWQNPQNTPSSAMRNNNRFLLPRLKTKSAKF